MSSPYGNEIISKNCCLTFYSSLISWNVSLKAYDCLTFTKYSRLMPPTYLRSTDNSKHFARKNVFRACERNAGPGPSCNGPGCKLISCWAANRIVALPAGGYKIAVDSGLYRGPGPATLIPFKLSYRLRARITIFLLESLEIFFKNKDKLSIGRKRLKHKETNKHRIKQTNKHTEQWVKNNQVHR